MGRYWLVGCCDLGPAEKNFLTWETTTANQILRMPIFYSRNGKQPLDT